MRRQDRAMTEEAAWRVADHCEWAVISMIDTEGKPYGVPVSMAREGQRLYFHAATEGKKLECLRAHPQVWVTCVGNTQRALDKFTTYYQSAMLEGIASEVTSKDEKIHALKLICQRHTPSNMTNFDEAIARSLGVTAVWCVDVEKITGKEKKNKG